ncbi:MAG: hypothetical protein RBT80_09560 [Candidatus Vecturithrix sp.]|nr:hypothetical protein [Candidatus Vecturithrix sp.]
MFVVPPSGENCPNATGIVGMAAMDFKRVIELIVTNFDQCKIEYAFIGGFALGALGCLRSTMDMNPLGSIDLLHAFRPRALAMLTRARRIPVFQGRYGIPC